MKTVEISYNPYKMTTEMTIDNVDVCRENCASYNKIKEFIEQKIPLQTWIEPVPSRGWSGIVNEISDPENNDEVKVIFSGRKIDFQDLQRSIAAQNEKRSEETRVIYHFEHKKVCDDDQISANIDDVVKELKTDRFRALVEQRTTESLRKKYDELDENYQIAKEKIFKIVFAGTYSSGKSTLLNVLMRHNILPVSDETCTSRNCRIIHDGSLGNRVSLTYVDSKGNTLIDKQVFDNDYECAETFAKICSSTVTEENEDSDDIVMELGADLSHLYPASVDKNNFRIVLMDTPGMDSADTNNNEKNKHAETALEAVFEDGKPMIILCFDARYTDNKNIGEIMREIIAQSKEEKGGFNDRFLFLMNKSDERKFNKNQGAADVKLKFVKYLTTPSKWGIETDDEELKQLAEDAAQFVPRVFLTSAGVALAIQCKANVFSEKEYDAEDYDEKKDMKDMYKSFEEKICGSEGDWIHVRANYYLSRYCDIPDYRKNEIEAAFNSARERNDKVHATELQCGVVAVESAIRDYIERYAYPIKVRDILETFEDILGDVSNFTDGTLKEIREIRKKLNEKNNLKDEINIKKKNAEEKKIALEVAKEEIEKQKQYLEKIQFDSKSLESAISDFREMIEADAEIKLLRENKKINTGQKTHEEVTKEIDLKILHIKNVFDQTLELTNRKLQKIQENYKAQIKTVFNTLENSVECLEKNGIFKQGTYDFKNSVFWNSNFSNINYYDLMFIAKQKVVDKETKEIRERNKRKYEWARSWNPFKKIGSLFMPAENVKRNNIDGYYDTTAVAQEINKYYLKLTKESEDLENTANNILNTSKNNVSNLISKVIDEIKSFQYDIENQKEFIKNTGMDINSLTEMYRTLEDTFKWLSQLKEKMEV